MKILVASLVLVCVVYSVQASWIQDYYTGEAAAEEKQLVVCIAKGQKTCQCAEYAKVL